MQSVCRQNRDWQPFLPGGTGQDWTPGDEDPTHGIEDIMRPAPNQNQVDRRATDKARSDFKDFLTCVATYCPDGFIQTVMNESSSYNWIINLIKTTFNLQTKGSHFLAGEELKLEFNNGFTYQQGFMKIKSFYTDSLLPANAVCEGRVP